MDLTSQFYFYYIVSFFVCRRFQEHTSHMHAHTNTHKHTHKHITHSQTHTHTNTHTQTHTHTHTHTHTQTTHTHQHTQTERLLCIMRQAEIHPIPTRTMTHPILRTTHKMAHNYSTICLVCHFLGLENHQVSGLTKMCTIIANSTT